jgi:hypothetical protein
MPISEDRVKGLETQTRDLNVRLGAIEKSLENLSKSFEEYKRPHWALAVLVALVLGWIGWLSLQVINQGNKLIAIGAILTPQETLKSLSAAVSPDDQKAKKELAQVADSIRKLSKARVSLPEQTVDETSEQLVAVSNTHKDLPETWAAIGAFITYRSQMIRGWEETNLPLCDSQFHRAQFEGFDKDSNTVTHGPVEVHDCKIILDSPGATGNLSIDLSMADVIFTHCAVFYNGGPVIFVPVKIATTQAPHFVGNIYFKNCLFVVSLPAVPDERGIDLARALLSSPDGDLTLKKAS